MVSTTPMVYGGNPKFVSIATFNLPELSPTHVGSTGVTVACGLSVGSMVMIGDSAIHPLAS